MIKVLLELVSNRDIFVKIKQKSSLPIFTNLVMYHTIALFSSREPF